MGMLSTEYGLDRVWQLLVAHGSLGEVDDGWSALGVRQG